MPARAFTLVLFLLFAGGLAPLHAQGPDNGLTANEVDQLRESALFPDQRIPIYMGFLDDRTRLLNELFAKPRHPGREDDAHDLIQQFNSIADELDDNLLDAREHHIDLRKVLPKLLAATERWSTDLRTPADDPHYTVIRKLALDSIRDLHDDDADILAQQKTWFAAHPPPKTQPSQEPPQPYTIPDPR